MGWIPRTRTIGLAAAIAALGACQVAPLTPSRPQPPTFRMAALAGPETSGPAAPVAVAGAPIPVKAPGVTPETGGQLVVSFGHVLPKAAQRRLLATVADVEKVTITLSGNGVNHTETILKAAITNGQTTFTFTGLPAGQLTVTIKALDVGGNVLGQDIKQATVTAGQTTTVTATVPLAPTVPAPQVIVTGASGGSGGSGGSTGTLTTNVTLRDDVPVLAPTVVGVHAPTAAQDTGLKANTVVLDKDGNAWFGGDFSRDATPDSAYAGKVTPAGVQSLVYTTNESWWWLRASNDGSLIILGPDATSQICQIAMDLDGFAHVAPMPVLDGLGFDLNPVDGSIYYVEAGLANGPTYKVVRMYDLVEKSTLLDSAVAPHLMATDLRLDKAGDVVVMAAATDGSATITNAEVRKYKPDGTLVFAHALPPSGQQMVNATFALDGQNNVWVLDEAKRQLTKLSPTGAVLATASTGARCSKLHVDALDRVWAYQSSWEWADRHPIRTSGEDSDVISRFSSAGVLEAYYSVGKDADTEEIAVSANDDLWVASKNKGLIHLKLAPLP